MNKKLLFGIMSLAALAACTNDDFDSQQQVAEGTSPVQFEVLNNDASMRAKMDGDAVAWEASKGDIFTLYHGAAYADAAAVTGYQNATYKAVGVTDGKATLTTPSMILSGSAIMVWPADTTFSIKSGDDLSFSIPAEQKADIENHIPYASDLIKIAPYANYDADEKNAYNTAGKDRKYPVYMRTMASLLKLKADYAGTEEMLKTLYTGEDKIDPIKATSVQLVTRSGGATEFTTTIPVTFTKGSDADKTRWNANVLNNAFSHITGVDREHVADKSATLTTECVEKDNSGCKFIILPQAAMATDNGEGVLDGGVVVNTIYGKVYIAETYPTGYPAGCKYSDTDIAGAWYRYVKASTAADEGETKSGTPEADGDYAGKYKVTSKPEFGLQQTINAFGTSTAGDTKPAVQGEYIGAVATRFVKVLLTKLNMEDLHIKTDKQLRDAARVWKTMNLADVTVYLDGDANGKFEISQKTIKVINDINDGIEGGAKSFKVKPCTVTDEKCTDIVVTGGGEIQNMDFIKPNATTKVNVIFNEGETWNWKGAVKVDDTAVTRFINKGTMENAESATIKTTKADGSANNVPLRNDAIWNIKAGKLFVQFTVTNNGGTVNISKNAEYRQDGNGHIFYNWASTLPKRITKADTESIGLVNNYGVFATVNNGTINNYGLIEHKDVDAKTYISANDNSGAGFGTKFQSNNKIGRINLPYSNRNEDNISVNAALNKGFVSVTVTAEELAKAGVTSTSLDASVVGEKVNYIIVNSGITEISKVKSNILYLEIADAEGKEIAWNVTEDTEYEGLIVLSPVNIKQGTTINVKKGNFLGADMYVGGTFTFNGAAVTKDSFKSYYGDTSDKFATLYVTY